MGAPPSNCDITKALWQEYYSDIWRVLCIILFPVCHGGAGPREGKATANKCVTAFFFGVTAKKHLITAFLKILSFLAKGLVGGDPLIQ